MLKALQTMTFPANYYSVNVPGFCKALVMLAGIALCRGAI